MLRAAAAPTSPATRSGLGVWLPASVSLKEEVDGWTKQIDVFAVAADWLSFNGKTAALFSGEKLTQGQYVNVEGNKDGISDLIN